jgi:hypothetical protein
VRLVNLGIFRLGPATDAHDPGAAVTASLYCERLEPSVDP